MPWPSPGRDYQAGWSPRHLLARGRPGQGGPGRCRFAVLVTAITRAVDLARERNLEEVQAQADRRRDLDETRRLAYAVRSARQSRAAMITATLVNALADHAWPPTLTLRAQHVTAVLNAPGLASDSQRWLQQQIGQIK